MKNRKLVIGASLILIGLAGMLITHLVFSYTTDGGRKLLFKGSAKSNSVEEGRRIYVFGINGRGERIPFDLKGRPRMHRRQIQMMRGRGLGCIECHRKDGRGGRRFDEDRSADIRWQELEKEKFNFEKFKGVVTKGKENGEEISNVMPRYSMTDSELNSLIKYLKTLK